MSDETVEVEIESLAAGGDGVGRDAKGRVVFVPDTAPGDRILAIVREARARYARAECVDLLHAGPGRVEASCAVAKHCGGCAWQHLAYPVQEAAKQGIVRDALLRVGRFDASSLPILEWIPSPPFGYRGRARVLSGAGGVGYRRKASHELCAIRACPVLHTDLEPALASIAAPSSGAPEEWELLLTAGGASAQPQGAAGPAREIVCGDTRFRVSRGVFVQGNTLLLPSFVELVRQIAGHGLRVLELFAGAGFLSVALARVAAHFAAVESHRAACDDLRFNLARENLPGEVWCERVDAKTLRRALARARPDLVVLDPPRAGLGIKSARVLAEAPDAPAQILYIACDPATWARDLRVFSERGYSLRRLVALDFFPQTAHVETLAWLARE